MANKMALGSRPQEQYAKKLVGKVLVKTGKNNAKLILQEEDGRTFANGTDTLTVAITDLPKHPKLQLEDKVGKEYRVRMNSDGDEVEALTPVRGHFQAKLVDLGPRPEKDADPLPKEIVFDEGGQNEARHLEFFAVYEITSGVFKSVQLPGYWMHYKFEEDPNNEGFTRFAGNFENRKATRLFQLRDWGLAHKLWEDDIPWDDESILPELLERALDKDVEVEVNLSNGYILREGGVMPSDGYNEKAFGVDESIDDVDKEFPAKTIEDVQDKVNFAGKNGKHPVLPPVKKIKKVKAGKDSDDDL